MVKPFKYLSRSHVATPDGGGTILARSCTADKGEQYQVRTTNGIRWYDVSEISTVVERKKEAGNAEQSEETVPEAGLLGAD